MGGDGELQKKFEEAQITMAGLEPSQEDLLLLCKLFSLFICFLHFLTLDVWYKQSVTGDCNAPKPPADDAKAYVVICLFVDNKPNYVLQD